MGWPLKPCSAGPQLMLNGVACVPFSHASMSTIFFFFKFPPENTFYDLAIALIWSCSAVFQRGELPGLLLFLFCLAAL